MQAVVRASIDALESVRTRKLLMFLRQNSAVICTVGLFLKDDWESGHTPCLHRKGRKSGLVSSGRQSLLDAKAAFRGDAETLEKLRWTSSSSFANTPTYHLQIDGTYWREI